VVDIAWFGDSDSLETHLVGGKAANLGVLAQAGFPVPPGYTVTTAAYRAFMKESGLDKVARQTVAELAYDDHEKIEIQTAQLRAAIEAATFPTELGKEITAAYARLATLPGAGGAADPFVAVRSSGTAEDTGDSSFAGLHDSYLDIKGDIELLDGVKRCWASMWSARATVYRNSRGFDHDTVSMAVIVQVMVQAVSSGVMFTANPLNTATDEIVINSSWGLGEAVVQGMVTPDEFVVDANTLAVKRRTLGSKEFRIVRDTESGTGVIQLPADRPDEYSLSDANASALARIGLRVQAHYSDLPQDMEWVFADDTLFLVQARPVTGVAFSWDADVDAWQTSPAHQLFVPEAERDDTVWTRAAADDFWTGAVTPLMYSWRGTCLVRCFQSIGAKFGIDELTRIRVHKYYKGEVYFNPRVQQLIAQRLGPPAIRKDYLPWIPPVWQQETMDAPFSWTAYLKAHARLEALYPRSGVLNWSKSMTGYVVSTKWHPDNMPDLQTLSDGELRRIIEAYIAEEDEYDDTLSPAFFVFLREEMSLLDLMVRKWYDGKNPTAYADLITGAKERTPTFDESLALYNLATRVRDSKYLLATYQATEGGDFFTALEDTEEGREFLVDYKKFRHETRFRGHEDRDIYFPRRGDDPSLDYVSIGTLMNVEVDPETQEEVVNARRNAAYDDVLENIRKKPLGSLKAEAFKILCHHTQEFMWQRDFERWNIDRLTYCTKLQFEELGRRLRERGLLEGERDFWFLTKHELYSVWDGSGNMKLLHAKIAARMANFDKFNNRESAPPLYLHHGQPAIWPDGEIEDSDALNGIATASGVVTGTARIIKQMSDIGRLAAEDILVCNSTDPGWTPAFLTVRSVVTETGGLLSHASCLCREYGMPSVQLKHAMQRIPEGALIEVNGDTGQIVILEQAEVEAEPELVEA
jgi:phosphohistidine swiveling domain-containing protein